MKRRNSIKRIVSLLLIIFQMRVAGGVSNLVNMNGVKNYNELVENFADFLLEQGITDPQQIYEYYNHAMWNGYFSIDHELKYSVNRKVYLDNPGMSIMSGDAVCLNYADMLSLIYREMGFNSYMSMCYVDSDKVNIERIRTDKDIERKIEAGSSEALDRLFDNFFIDGITKIFGNHAITCVEHNGEVYIFDPTNLVYLSKSGFNNVDIVNGSGKFDLRYFTSLLYDNINIFKVIPSTNNKDYKLEVVNKDELKIDEEALEKFYNENKNFINEVDKSNKRGSDGGLIEIMIYAAIASFVITSIKSIINKIADNCKEKDLNDLFPLLKEYFSEKNIKSEFEILSNYQLINSELGIKNSFVKDLFIKSFDILNRIINNDSFHINMLSFLLNELEYQSSVTSVKKYTHGLYVGDSKLIKYRMLDGYYLYDPELNELLYEEGDVFYSKDRKYKYKPYVDYMDKVFGRQTLYNKEDVENKMNNENNILTKEDIKELKLNKNLRI